ncbi:hypothetical protein D3C78_994280 [compost metagenome]
MPALLGDHRPAPHGAGIIQRATGIDLPTVVVPGTAREAEFGLGHGLAAFAHEIDATGGAARALHHPGGAAQDFDTVVIGHVAAETVGLDIAVAHVQRNAVVLILAGHPEPTGIEILAAHGRVVDGDAGGLFHHLIDGVEVLVIEHLAGDHRHRLRRFAQGMLALADGHRARRVGATVLGGRPEHLSLDAGGSQFHDRTVGGQPAQHVRAVGLGLSLQATTAKNASETVTHAEGTSQAGRLQILQLPGIKRQGDTGGAGEAGQHIHQAAGANIVGLHRALLRRGTWNRAGIHGRSAGGGDRQQADFHCKHQTAWRAYPRHISPPPKRSIKTH